MFQPKSINNENTSNSSNQELPMGNKVFNNNSENNLVNGYISSEADIDVYDNTPNGESSENFSPQPSDDNIYYMPDKFLQPNNATGKQGKNWFLIIGITLIVIVVLSVGGFAYYVLSKNENNEENILNLPQNNDSQNNIDQNQTSTTTETKLDTPKLRDAKRIQDITNIISGLSLYYNDNKKYPPILDRLDQYLKSIPVNPEPGGEAYYYQPQDKSQNYILTFSLESGAELGNLILKANKYQATAKSGIEIYKDSTFDIDDNSTSTIIDDQNDDNQQGLLPIPPKGNDADGDQLTDMEEIMYGTKINISDSDSDNYSDGSEIYSLYDPLNSNSRLVDNINLVGVYDNENYGYSVLYPKKWKVDIKNTNFSDIVFSGDASSDFFQIQVKENPQGFTLKNWYLSNSNNANSNNLKDFSNNNVYGIQTQDNMNVYIGNGNKIYIISYIIKNTKSLEYFRTFEMLLQSFKFINIVNNSTNSVVQPPSAPIIQGGSGNEG